MIFDLKLEKDFELKVGAHTVKVKFVSHEDPKLKEGNGKNASFSHGVFDLQEYAIYISKDDSFSMRLSTFYHEFLHVLEDSLQIKLSHKDINLIGEMLSALMIDNFEKSPAKSKR